MTAIVDRGVIFLLSILLLEMNQVDYKFVCLILVSVISVCINIYFDNKHTVCIMTCVYALLCAVVPQICFFLPLNVYESGRKRIKLLLPIHLGMGIVCYNWFITDNYEHIDIFKIAIFMVIAFIFGIRSAKFDEMDKKIYKLKDEESYLRQNSRQRQDELLKRQDYEIHTATLAERNRIAREIHDHVGHMISRAILQLGAIMAVNREEKMKEPLGALKNSLDTAMSNIRESVHDIKDEALDLEYMIKDVFSDFNTLHIDLDYDMGKYASKDLKYCVVAIVKEALTNTVKHSDATTVNIVLREHPAMYQLLIQDNGSSVKEKVLDKSGIGLDNMRERVAAFRGNILFTHENGFRIFISIPKEN